MLMQHQGKFIVEVPFGTEATKNAIWLCKYGGILFILPILVLIFRIFFQTSEERGLGYFIRFLIVSGLAIISPTSMSVLIKYFLAVNVKFYDIFYSNVFFGIEFRRVLSPEEQAEYLQNWLQTAAVQYNLPQQVVEEFAKNIHKFLPDFSLGIKFVNGKLVEHCEHLVQCYNLTLQSAPKVGF